MNHLDKIEKLLSAIQKSSDTEKERDFGIVETCVMAYTDYHNEAVSQGRLISFQKFRLDDEGLADFINALHTKRKNLHKTMIEKTVVLNNLCEHYGEPKIYEGPLDKVKGRDNPDTRYGVAEFAEQLCTDFYHTTYETAVPDVSKQAYRKHAANIHDKEGKWGMMEKMMEHAEARRGMRAGDTEAFAKAVAEMSSPNGKTL